MVIYQLPNGKIIRLTIEEYLNLTDDDILELVGMDYGESNSSPWLGSIISLNVNPQDFEDFDTDREPPDIKDDINLS